MFYYYFEQLYKRQAAGAVWNAFDESPLGWRFLAAANVFYFVTLLLIYTFMKNREPFSCKAFMKVYNLICVVLAGISAYCMIHGKLIQTNFVCNPNADETEAGKLMLFGSQLFYVQKFWEFLDTFIFLLRKKSRQVCIHDSNVADAWCGCASDSFLFLLLSSVCNALRCLELSSCHIAHR